MFVYFVLDKPLLRWRSSSLCHGQGLRAGVIAQLVVLVLGQQRPGNPGILVGQRKQQDPEHPSWLQRLLGRVHPNIAAVALANKNARVAWALLAKHQDYKLGYDPSTQTLPMAQAA